MDETKVVHAVQQWVDSFVVELNLCPFAKRELTKGRVRFVSVPCSTQDELLIALQDELERLENNPAIETTLVIHAEVLHDFYDYDDFLDIADSLLVAMDLEGVYQIASFHPDYQFDGTNPDDAENYTNRSPYPILHLLRETSIESVALLAGEDQIPMRNIATMNRLGEEKLKKMLALTKDDPRH